MTIFEIDASAIEFDLMEDSSSDDNDRTFDSDVSYNIYIRIESDATELNTDGDSPGTESTGSSAESLGSTDKILLAGGSVDEEGAGSGPAQTFTTAGSDVSVPDPITGNTANQVYLTTMQVYFATSQGLA
jgi:hypothetical protein